MSREFRKLNPDIKNAGAEFEKFAQAETKRIRVTTHLEDLRRRFSKLAGITALATSAMGAWQIVAASAAIAASSLSGLLVGVSGGGLAGAFAYLAFTTQKFKDRLTKVGNYIRDDLMKKTMKGFYDQVGKMPSVFKKAYNSVKPELSRLGKAMEPLIKIFYKSLPDLTKSVVDLFTSVAKASKPFFKALMDGLPLLIDGLKGFFDAFKKDGDPQVVIKVLEDIGDAIKNLGEFLAGLDGADYEKFVSKVKEVFKTLVGIVRGTNRVINGLDDALGNVGISITKLIVPSLVLWGIFRTLGPVIQTVDVLWAALNAKLLKSNLTTVATQSGLLASGLGKVPVPASQATTALSRLAVPLGPLALVIGIVVTSLAAWYIIIKKINEQGSILNNWWNALGDSQEFQGLVDAWNDFKESVTQSIAEVKVAWDDLYATLQETGLLDALKTLGAYLAGGFLTSIKSAFTAIAFALKAAAIVIEGVAGGIKGALQVIESRVTVVKNAFNLAKIAITKAWNAISNKAESASTAIGNALGKVKAAVQSPITAFNRMRTQIAASLTNLLGKARSFAGSLVSNLRSGATRAVTVMVTGFASLPGRMAGIFASVVGAARTMAANLVAAVVGLPAQFFSIGSNIVSSLASGIASGAGSVITAAINVATSALNAAKNALGINSPSRKFIEIGEGITEGLAIGMSNTTRVVQASASLARKAAVPFEVLYKKWDNLQKTKGKSDKQAKQDMESYRKMRKFFNQFNNELAKYRQRIADAYKGQQQWNVEANGGNKLDKLKATWSDLTNTLKGYQEALAEVTNPSTLTVWANAVDTAKSAWDSAVAALDTLRSNAAAWYEEINGAAYGTEKYFRNIYDAAKSAFDSATSALASWREELGQLDQEGILKQVWNNAKDALSDLIDRANSFKDSIKQTVLSALDLKSALDASMSMRNKGNFLAGLRQQAKQAKEFAKQVETLKKLGASEELIAEIQKAGIVDGLAIMKKLTSPAAVAEANALIKDVLGTAENLANGVGDSFYSAQIDAAQNAVAAAEAILTAFYEQQVADATIALQNAIAGMNAFYVSEDARLAAEVDRTKNVYISTLQGAIGALQFMVNGAKAAIDAYWIAEIASQKKNTKELEKLWKKYGKKITEIMGDEGFKAGKNWGKNYIKALKGEVTEAAVASAAGTINVNKFTINVSGGQNAQATGRAIVAAIQEYERTAGASWRR